MVSDENGALKSTVNLTIDGVGVASIIAVVPIFELENVDRWLLSPYLLIAEISQSDLLSLPYLCPLVK